MRQKTGVDLNTDLNTGSPAGNINAMNAPINVLELFQPADFPASKMELIVYAQDRGASEDALDELQAIPDDIYDSISALNTHLGEMEMVEDQGDLWGSEESREFSDDRDRALAELKGRGRL